MGQDEAASPTASTLYYKKFVTDIKSIRFIPNPYDPCVANHIMNGKQHTLTWHVDNIKVSHVDSKVNERFLVWLEKTYGEDGIGTVKVTRGPMHDYLGMMLDYSTTGVVTVDMVNYVTQMCLDFPYDIEEFNCPWTDKLFKVDVKSKPLEEERSKIFHTFVMKEMFASKRARQDVQLAISFLCTRTKKPAEQDWSNLLRMIGVLKKTKNDINVLEASDDQKSKWHVHHTREGDTSGLQGV
jgi:hypothetical protein